MTTITALPPAPSRTDPATFSDKSDALLGALDTFVTQTNTVAGECVANAASAAEQVSLAAEQVSLAAGQVSLAAGQVALATAQADAAAISATAASGSAIVAGATAWVSGTTYAIGDARYSPINLQTYRRKTNGGGTTDPSADSTNWAKAVEGGISNVVTATTNTTLTSTPTLLKITPDKYGVTVTLPNATTCSVGGPLHIIDNSEGIYPVLIKNNSASLLGFVYAGAVSHISLSDNSTAVGVWDATVLDLYGPTASLVSATQIANISGCIDIGSNKEFILGCGASYTNLYGVVFDRSTNTFGAITLIRTATFAATLSVCVKSATDQILVTSCPTTAATFEAVVLSISGTTITVNTAATATLSSNISGISDGSYGLIPAGSSFVISYVVDTPAHQIRALTISGTTVTIGSATTLNGGVSASVPALIFASGSVVITAGTATTNLYIVPYTVSGTTLSVGTGATVTSGTMTLNKMFALGSYWGVIYNDGGSTVKGGVITLSGTTTTISTVTLFSASTLTGAIVVGTTKVLALNAASTSNANILTNTAGTASAGTAITLTSDTSRFCLYSTSTNVAVHNGINPSKVSFIDCSGSSPVISSIFYVGYNFSTPVAENQVLAKSTSSLVGSSLYQYVMAYSSAVYSIRVRSGYVTFEPQRYTVGTNYGRGRVDSERWIADGFFSLTKMECVA